MTKIKLNIIFHSDGRSLCSPKSQGGTGAKFIMESLSSISIENSLQSYMELTDKNWPWFPG